MAEPKTKKNAASVIAFLRAVPDEQKRRDSLDLLRLFTEVTSEKAAMWGTSIVGFGMYHYKSTRSRREGTWPITAFSPRKQSLTLYIMPGSIHHAATIKKLGTYTTTGVCLYIKRLSDIDLRVLKKLIRDSVAYMKKRYPHR